ncbi:MAG: CoA transferase [Dehalococcoidia bacterium]|jgi:formyl-CoA transferase|nr:CoA transferase [Dehalococcoidia bacterium]
MKSGALNGIRVIDFSTSVSGAWCARMLADFGADVALFEAPDGHPTRRLAPFDDTGASVVAEYVLANRRSAVVDLEQPGGLEAIHAAVESADVLVCSSLPGELKPLGLDFGSLNQLNPRIIVCSITPHGSSGPRASYPGNNLTTAALSGWASINGLRDRPPLKPGGLQASYCAGTMGYGSVVSALLARRKHPTGRGQFIDISELEVMTSTFAPALLTSQYQDEPQSRQEKVDMSTGPVPVKDGHFALTISRPHFWRDAMNVLGLDDLAEDPRWATSWYRKAHTEEYVGRAQEKLADWNKMDLFDTLAALRVIAGPVLETDELAENVHLRAREFFRSPDGGGPELPGPAFKMSATPSHLVRRAPRTGEHTAEALHEFSGLEESAIDGLLAAGVVR